MTIFLYLSTLLKDGTIFHYYRWGNRGVVDIIKAIQVLWLCCSAGWHSHRGHVHIHLTLWAHKETGQIIRLFPALKCSSEAQREDHASNTKCTYTEPIDCAPRPFHMNSNTPNPKRSYWFYFPDLLRKVEGLAWGFTASKQWCQDLKAGLSHSEDCVPPITPYFLLLRNKLTTEDIEADDFGNQV